MITLNRKKGEFLKIFCPEQLNQGTFMPSIECWWDLKEIRDKLPPGYMKQLTQPGRAGLLELPTQPLSTHSGFILSHKDYEKADQERELGSVLIRRRLNDDELQMKLVLPSGYPMHAMAKSNSR